MQNVLNYNLIKINKIINPYDEKKKGRNKWFDILIIFFYFDEKNLLL